MHFVFGNDVLIVREMMCICLFGLHVELDQNRVHQLTFLRIVITDRLVMEIVGHG
jgi:hypothetical protein